MFSCADATVLNAVVPSYITLHLTLFVGRQEEHPACKN